jgi:Protein of unknown function (DUF3102)
MASRKDRMAGVEVVHQPPPRKPKAEMRLLDPEQIRREVAPLANLLPSQEVRNAKVLPPHRRMRQDLAELRTRANFADAIEEAWTEAEENFTTIGRYLNHAKSMLNHGEFMGMVESDLPFRYSTANRLMKVAAALDAGALPADRLPPSYATVYELLTLSDEERRQAIKEGVVRPDMQRKDVTEFRKRLRQPDQSKRAKLETEREKLRKRLQEIEAELASIADAEKDTNRI